MTFRLAYDVLRKRRGERADVEYVRILHLAATTMESTVDSALANPTPSLAPMLSLSGIPDLRVYDNLLSGVA